MSLKRDSLLEELNPSRKRRRNQRSCPSLINWLESMQEYPFAFKTKLYLKGLIHSLTHRVLAIMSAVGLIFHMFVLGSQ